MKLHIHTYMWYMYSCSSSIGKYLLVKREIKGKTKIIIFNSLSISIYSILRKH